MTMISVDMMDSGCGYDCSWCGIGASDVWFDLFIDYNLDNVWFDLLIDYTLDNV